MRKYPDAMAPLEPWLNDPDVIEIMVNGYNNVYLERGRRLVSVPTPFRDDEHLMEVIHALFALGGRRVNESSPMADTSLFDDARANVVIPPISVLGPALTIRKFGQKPLTVDDLLHFGFWNEDVAEFLRACVRARLNIVVAGGTGSGKTTTLNILTGMIPADERIVTVENAGELRLPKEVKRVVRLASRPPDTEGKGEITIRDLFINALRMRADRIIVGETRGAEGLDLLQAMNTGHDGTMTTVHANSPRDLLARLEIMAAYSDFSLPLLTVRQMVASAIDLIVYQERMQDGSRKVLNVTEVVGMQGDAIMLQDIYVYRQAGFREGRVRGHHVATGTIPKCFNRIREAGIDLPVRLFTPQHRPAESRERRQVITIFFSDLRGFTQYSETHTPEHTADMLKTYLDRMARIIRQNGGIVHKYLGDSLMAVFGASLRPIQDHAWKAVLTAWQMQRDIRAYHGTLPADDRLHLAVGINTGEVLVGGLGGEGQNDYIGDAANLAARSERLAQRGQIVIGENTYQQVKDKVEARALPALPIKGGKEHVQVYEVLGLVE